MIQSDNRRLFLTMSTVEGICYTLMVATAESFAIFLGVQKGLSGLELAAISTVPALLGALSQWIIPRFVSESHLSNSILASIFVQITGLVGLVIVSQQGFPFAGLLISLSLYWIGGLTTSPLWLDWLSCRFPTTFFRTFLSKRNRTLNFLVMIFYVLAAYALHFSPQISPTTIFVIGLVGRSVSLILQYFTARLTPAPIKRLSAEQNLVTTVQEERNLKSLFAASLVCTGLFVFAVNLSGPFMIRYYVDKLHFNVWDYVLITATPLLGRALFLEGWGRASGGSKPFLGLGLACAFISLNPILVLISPNPYYLMAAEFFGGIFWAGYELSNILIVRHLGFSGSRKYFGLNMAVRQIMALLGAIAGGLLLDHRVQLTDLFYLSAILRITLAIVLIVVLSRWAIARFTLKTYGDYLSTVLSLRPNLAYTGRMIFARRTVPRIHRRRIHFIKTHLRKEIENEKTQ